MAPLGVFLIALTVRLLHVWQIRRAPFFDVLLGDAHGYDEWAQRIAAGDWIGRDVFYQAPLYPYFLGVVYKLFGHSLVAARVAQAIIGSGSCALLSAAATRLFSRTVGLVAGLMLALYAPAIFFDGLLQKSVLDVFFVCLALYFVAALTTTSAEHAEPAEPKRPQRILRVQRLTLWLCLGLAIGALSLTRENALVFVVVLAVWAFVRSRVNGVAAFALGVAMVVAPVAIRNSVIGGGFYITTSQFGPNLYIGNHPGADGSYQSLRYGRGAPEFERQDATELAERALHRSLTPGEVSSYWTDRAFDFMAGQPAAWLRLLGRKIVLLWNATEMVDTEDQSTHADWSLPLKVLGPVGHFGVLVPLAVIGLFLTWRDRDRLWIVYVLIATYAVSVVVFYVFARYRYPLVPLLIPFAAVAAASFRRIPKPESRIPITVAVFVAIFCNWPVASAQEMRAVTETNLGVALQSAQRVDDAIDHYRRAIAERPDYAPAHSNLATALRAKKQFTESVAAYERALQLQPDFAAAHYNLANLLLDEGQPEAAAEHFEKAASEEPAAADVHNNLGIAFAAAGRTADAIREFETALTLDPQSPLAKRNLAGLHYDLGGTELEASRFADAEREFRATLRIDPTMVEAHNNLGIALASQGKLADAIVEFRQALAIKPDFADAQKNLAMALGATSQRRLK
ncbi:MAG TPA: tetratricopeptide repeat protein [Vicinamibacterales bacterium]|nr:tetratricopeptide repeat protein [Vicinamibacterales bacterium]